MEPYPDVMTSMGSSSRVYLARDGALPRPTRPQVHKLLDQGSLEFRKVGAHHRIRVESIQECLDAERPRRRSSLAELAQLQDELGLTE